MIVQAGAIRKPAARAAHIQSQRDAQQVKVTLAALKPNSTPIYTDDVLSAQRSGARPCFVCHAPGLCRHREPELRYLYELDPVVNEVIRKVAIA